MGLPFLLGAPLVSIASDLLPTTATRSPPRGLDHERLTALARLVDLVMLAPAFLVGSGLLTDGLGFNPAVIACALLLTERVLHPPGRVAAPESAAGYWRILAAAVALQALIFAPLPPAPAVAQAALALVASLLVGRAGYAWALRHCRERGWFSRRVVVVGAGEQGRRYIDHLRGTSSDRRVIGVFDDRATRVPGWVAGFPVLGTIDDLVAFSRRHAVDEVALALPWTADARVGACLEKLRRVAAAVHLCPDLAAFELAGRPVATRDGLPSITVHRRRGSVRQRLAKGLFDRTLAALALAFCGPLFLSLAVVALFESRRVFAREDLEDCFGRTVAVHHFAFAASAGSAAGGAALTRLGLHRLPCLLDVLAGRVSFIGPRPHAGANRPEQRRLAEERLAPYGFKPGLLSPADIELTSDARPLARLEVEEAYVAHWSILRDLRLLSRALL